MVVPNLSSVMSNHNSLLKHISITIIMHMATELYKTLAMQKCDKKAFMKHYK